jgi:hypothetical protein
MCVEVPHRHWHCYADYWEKIFVVEWWKNFDSVFRTSPWEKTSFWMSLLEKARHSSLQLFLTDFRERIFRTYIITLHYKLLYKFQSYCFLAKMFRTYIFTLHYKLQSYLHILLQRCLGLKYLHYITNYSRVCFLARMFRTYIIKLYYK